MGLGTTLRHAAQDIFPMHDRDNGMGDRRLELDLLFSRDFARHGVGRMNESIKMPDIIGLMTRQSGEFDVHV
ncbi:hypothetical protein D7S86_11560 [Pararobbsia silviterrae]|uniref:Uncharacterized protein n=1 Tax=Pararobbsia silviterrae TaxID=1792498 RepID=A0A494XZ94_9BURK|nr:hypothetical protein D7S86_11560 [Pararobbsia silviterrae]